MEYPPKYPVHPFVERLDTRSLYDNSTYSDILIKYSGGHQVKAHRLVLCEQSNYFKKLCHPDSGFAEANAKEITLRDDDPDALEAVLRYLYGFADHLTEHGDGLLANASQIIQVIITADKYGLDLAFIKDLAEWCELTVARMEDAVMVLSALKMCTVGSEIHPSLTTAVDRIISTEMTILVELPEWFEWAQSVPVVHVKIFREAAVMKLLKRSGSIEICMECEDIDSDWTENECSGGSDHCWQQYEKV